MRREREGRHARSGEEDYPSAPKGEFPKSRRIESRGRLGNSLEIAGAKRRERSWETIPPSPSLKEHRQASTILRGIPQALPSHRPTLLGSSDKQ